MKKNNFIATVISICVSISFGILKASFRPENEELNKTNHFHVTNETDTVHAHSSTFHSTPKKDKENKALKKIIINKFFSTYLLNIEANDEFIHFRNNVICPFGSYNLQDNHIILSIMYFLESHQKEVNIRPIFTSNQNLKFKFLHCVNPESGENINLSFDQGDFQDPHLVNLYFDTTDTIFAYLKSTNILNIPMYAKALYKIAIFKIDTDFYRFNVQLSVEDIPGSDKYLNKKNSNFSLKIQHIQ